MAEKFIASEKDRVMKETETYTRSTLAGFAEVMDGRKGAKWNIRDVTEADGRAYYDSLSKSRDGERGKRLRTVLRFMGSAVNKGWINELPWRELYEHKKGGAGHFHVSEKERKRLMKYLTALNPADIWGFRDRAMILLLLTCKLKKSEVSNLDMTDYDGRRITIRSSMQWRNREIEIEESVRDSIDTYLVKRRELKEAVDEKALFVGLRRKRISPGMIYLLLKELINRGCGR